MFGFISRYRLRSHHDGRTSRHSHQPPTAVASATAPLSRKKGRRRLAFEAMEQRVLLSHGPAFCADHPDHPHCGGGGGGGGGDTGITYTVVDLNTLGGTNSYAADINDAGQVVGNSRTASGDLHAFLWEDVNANRQSDAGEMIDLGTLGGGNSFAIGMNGFGQVVGTSPTASGDFRAFLWQDLDGNGQSDAGEMIDLGTLGGPTSSASGINGSGQVVGNADTASGEFHSFLITPEDTNDDGVPDLWFRDDDGDGANDLMMELGTLGGDESRAKSINDLGQVVGNALTASGELHAFLIRPQDVDMDGTLDWFVDVDTDGANDLMIDLGTSEALAINENGQIVGRSDNHPVIWEVDLAGNVTATQLGVPKGGFNKAGAGDINDAAQVVGGAGKDRGIALGGHECNKFNIEPFLWQDGQVIRFEDLVSDMGGFGDLDDLTGINNSGQIIGIEILTNSPCDPVHAFIALPSTTGSSSTASASLTAAASESTAASIDFGMSDDASGDDSTLVSVAEPLPSSDTGSTASADSEPAATSSGAPDTTDAALADFDAGPLDDALLEDLAVALVG